MLRSYTILELLLALAVFVLVAFELSGILQARKEGLSQNVSRIVIRAAMLGLLFVYAVFAYVHLPLEVGEGGIDQVGMPTVPWGYLLIGVLLTLLAAVEAVGMIRARRKGLTTNVSRLVHHTVSFLVLLAMLGLAVRKWDHYLERLDRTIAEGPPGTEEVLQRRAESLKTAAEEPEPGEEAEVTSEGEGGEAATSGSVGDVSG